MVTGSIDFAKYDTLVDQIRSAVGEHPSVVAGVGPFSSLFRLNEFKKPPLISASVDGVGTKPRLASLLRRYREIGVDVVNHSVNDVLTSGAHPLFFLDYIGSSGLDQQAKLELIQGMVDACRDAKCVLIGGETADMPQIYQEGDFDLVGFMIGACEEDDQIDPMRTRPRDVLIGLPSNGLHTNGYSLAREALSIGLEPGSLKDIEFLERHQPELGETLADALLRPHRSYLADLTPFLTKVRSLAHITGGGIAANLGRVIPAGLRAVVERGTWQVPPIFSFIQRSGQLSDDEMFGNFNMGIGMIAVVDPKLATDLMAKIPCFRVGLVERTLNGHDPVAFIDI